MNNQKDQMKWVLFWVFLILFILMVLGTLAMVFLGFGSPTESERALMVKGLIGEVAACIIALFYSIFGLKEDSEKTTKLQELESKTSHVISVIESLKLSNKEFQTTPPSNINQMSSISSLESITINNFENRISLLGTKPPFPIEEYDLMPLPIDIKNDIKKAKPIDVKYRKSLYKGMKVQWKAILSSVDETNEGKLRVTADLDESMLYVSFEVDKNINNTLLTADEGKPFWLCGEIAEAESYKIEMNKVQIKFKEQT